MAGSLSPIQTLNHVQKNHPFIADKFSFRCFFHDDTRMYFVKGAGTKLKRWNEASIEKHLFG
jgi:hypothetical protein